MTTIHRPTRTLQEPRTPPSRGRGEEEKPFEIGIIGGGQLAWMLGLACRDLGVSCSVYAQGADDAAALSDLPTTLGSLSDSRQLQSWMECQKRVLIESELTPFSPLQSALQGAQRELTPSLQALSIARDKLQQKILFHQLGLITAPWTEFESTNDPQSVLNQLRGVHEQFGQGIVLKWALEGYDGKGVLVIKQQDLQSLDEADAFTKDPEFKKILAFFQTAHTKQTKIYGESLIPFQWEMAITMTRRRSQDTPQPEEVVYPLVISEQLHGTCYRVRSLTSEPELNPPGARAGADLEAQAVHAARVIGDHLGIVGTFALEFFVTPDQVLLINEMAPRVHNSSHCSQVAKDASQFHNHIRAALDLPLLKPIYPSFYGMTNLLGPEGYEGPMTPPEVPKNNHMELYWYDKKTTKTRRKLGHINAWADSAQGFQDQQQEVERLLAGWKKTLPSLTIHD